MGSDPAIDRAFLLEAQRLALQGWGRTYPNPLVGAIVADGDRRISGGSHLEFGGPHAEVAALAAAGEGCRGATMYVSLEPCAHHGKQPPCVDAVIAAGISRVVVGSADPNPEAAGGIALLRAAGIAVDIVADGAIPKWNFRFLHRFKGSPRPYVAIKLAVSMDGMIADAAGTSRWVSGPAAREWVHWLRAGYAAVAVGARTAIADAARLTVRGAIEPRLPTSRVVFDRSGVLPVDHVVFQDVDRAPLFVIVGDQVDASHRTALTRAGAHVGVSDTTDGALEYLASEGIDSILVEGGGRLAGSMLRNGLVDRIYQIQSPRWLGDGVRAWDGLGARSIDSSERWRVVNVEQLVDTDGDTDVLIEMEQ